MNDVERLTQQAQAIDAEIKQHWAAIAELQEKQGEINARIADARRAGGATVEEMFARIELTQRQALADEQQALQQRREAEAAEVKRRIEAGETEEAREQRRRDEIEQREQAHAQREEQRRQLLRAQGYPV